jgi:hypothetical protein
VGLTSLTCCSDLTMLLGLNLKDLPVTHCVFLTTYPSCWRDLTVMKSVHEGMCV